MSHHYTYFHGRNETEIGKQVARSIWGWERRKHANRKCAMQNPRAGVSIGGSEFFASGYALWFAKNFVENYFGMYNKVSDIDSFKAHTRLSRRMFGDVHEPVEFYRPLRLKMCVRVQNVRAHCLIHSVQTDGPVSDSCPVIYMEQFVVEVVRSLRETKIQVCLFGCAMFFERSRSFPTASEGFLTADTISFRGHAFLSEEGISWDAGSIEYAWIIELTVGNVVGKLHPTQVVMLLQFVETVHLMTNATDEELLVSENPGPTRFFGRALSPKLGESAISKLASVMAVYDLCQHMNDIRTCPRSNLGLTDAAFRTQNCESADNINVRLFTKAPSETAPSSGNWLECAKFYFEDIELVVQLPYAKEEGHLPRERKRFLRKHDRLTKSGCVFMSDFTQRLAVPKTDNEFPTQPGYMQSIIYHCKSALVNTPADFYKSMDVIVDIGTSDSRAFSQDRSTSVGPNVDYSDFMRRSILCCAPLMRSYSSFLAVFTFDIPRVEVPVFGAHGAINEWATNVAPIITKRRDGINELELRQLKRPLQDEAKKKRMPSSSSSAGMLPFRESAHPDWGADPSVLYVKGYVCTLAKLILDLVASNSSSMNMEDMIQYSSVLC
ncbi:unnamed protein product [Toxocara canis]|uniref:Copine domain-containing protein n=1 Tax=Toxocara canis TaxID=6265 RepID=A0A183UQE4_TOXCA|nr:unnamed protein product [Toxocara canis]